MDVRHRTRRHAILSAGLTIAVLLTVATTAVPAGIAGARVSARRHTASVTPAVGIRGVTMDRTHRLPSTRGVEPAGQVFFACQNPGGDAYGYCYGPDQIRAAYDIQPLLDHGVSGKRRTIVIVDAYAPPNVVSDLHTFDSTWGLPDPELTIVAPQGVPPYDSADPQQAVWSAEIALDTQWAHAVAPAAKIVLVEARSTEPADVLAATAYAVDHTLGDTISMSFGVPENCADPAIERAQHALFARAVRKNITLVAGAGDTGAAWPTCDGTGYTQAVASPASDPYVLSVGGTSITADPSTGQYRSETAWNESATFSLAGGGGYSTLYSKPSYQKAAVSGGRRGVPDVAYNASIGNGVLVYLSGLGPGTESFYALGGTSAGAPQWAGLIALTDQLSGHRVGDVHAALYALAARRKPAAPLHDITTGDNTFVRQTASGTITVPGYAATPGWDAVTGLGSPVAAGLVPYLALASH